MNNDKIFFAGEPNAGLHPKVVAAIQKANIGKDASYREDAETKKMLAHFSDLFGKPTRALMFGSGSAANITAIAAITKPYNSVICAKSGHISTYETVYGWSENRKCCPETWRGDQSHDE